MTLYEHMPDAIREVVDEIVEVLRPEPWRDSRDCTVYCATSWRRGRVRTRRMCFKSGAGS